MLRRSSLSVVVLAGLIVLAAGSDGIDIPEPDRDLRIEAEKAAAQAVAEADQLEADQAAAERHNVEACRAWIEVFNALECMPEAARINPETTCPETLNQACDQAAFWQCMRDKTRCEDGRPMRPDLSESPPPC